MENNAQWREAFAMKVVIDRSRYDDLQMEVGSAITHEIYTAMKRAGVADGEWLEKVVADALFRIGSIIDGSHTISSPGGTMQAVLTFANEKDGDTLISAGGGSGTQSKVVRISSAIQRLHPSTQSYERFRVRQKEALDDR